MYIVFVMRPLQGGILLNGAIRPSIRPSHPSPQVQNGSSKKLRILKKFLPGACKGHPQSSVLDFFESKSSARKLTVGFNSVTLGFFATQPARPIQQNLCLGFQVMCRTKDVWLLT